MKPQKFKARALTWAVASILAVGVGAFSSGSYAASPQTANLSVTATISANCTIATTVVAFGAYDPVVTNNSAALDGTGAVTTACTSGSSPVITLGQGANADTGSTDDVPLRRMSDGSAHYLSYFLYSNSGRTTVWGNTAGTGKVPAVIDGTAHADTVYGRVTGGQNKPVGSYTDTVVATVTF